MANRFSVDQSFAPLGCCRSSCLPPATPRYPNPLSLADLFFSIRLGPCPSSLFWLIPPLPLEVPSLSTGLDEDLLHRMQALRYSSFRPRQFVASTSPHFAIPHRESKCETRERRSSPFCLVFSQNVYTTFSNATPPPPPLFSLNYELDRSSLFAIYIVPKYPPFPVGPPQFRFFPITPYLEVFE